MPKKRNKNRLKIYLIIFLALEIAIIFLNIYNNFNLGFNNKNNKLEGELATLTLTGFWERYNWDLGTYCKGRFVSDGSQVTTACQDKTTGVWYTLPYCLDQICNGNENYQSCPSDCSATPTTYMNIFNLTNVTPNADVYIPRSTVNFTGLWEMYVWSPINSPCYKKYCRGGFLPDINRTKITTAYKNSSGSWINIPYCGDGVCGVDENSTNCPYDCGGNIPKPYLSQTPISPNAIIGLWERYIWDQFSPYYRYTCRGQILGDGSQIMKECQNITTGEWFKIPYCGDGICNNWETAKTCNRDCGPVKIPLYSYMPPEEDSSCDYSDQGGSSVLPCNQEIDLVSFLPTIYESIDNKCKAGESPIKMVDDLCPIVDPFYPVQAIGNRLLCKIAKSVVPVSKETALGRLEELGYSLNIIDASDGSTEFIDKIVKGTAQILVVYTHGSDNGFLLPVGCVKDTCEEKAKFYSKYIAYFNDATMMPSPIAFYNTSACSKGTVGVAIKPSRLKIKPRALYIGLNCFGGLSQVPATATVSSSGLTTVKEGYIDNDLNLFVNYLTGSGPGSKYFSAYPPLQKMHNIQVSDLMDFGGPKYVVEGQDLDSFSCTDDIGHPIPCFLRASGSVHLFPYVDNLAISSVGVTTSIGISFSDKVTKPSVSFKVEKCGKTVDGLIPKNIPDTGQTFSYDVISGVKIETEWTTYSNDKKLELLNKGEVKIGEIIISGSKAAVGKNHIQMVGNPLAMWTSAAMMSVTSPLSIPYFFYDTYFWYYNARTSGSDYHTFRARVPYRVIDCDSCKGPIEAGKIKWDPGYTPKEISISFSGIQQCGYVGYKGGIVSILSQGVEIPSVPGNIVLSSSDSAGCTWTDTNKTDDWEVIWSPGRVLELSNKKAGTYFESTYTGVDKCSNEVQSQLFPSFDPININWYCTGGYKGKAAITSLGC